MGSNPKFSRRAIVGGLAATPALPASTVVAGINSADVHLIGLGQQLESNRATLERASGHDEAMVILDKIDALTLEIVVTRAQTLQGLYVKARASAWALESDCGLLDPVKESSPNDRVAASIVRDLLEFGAPDA